MTERLIHYTAQPFELEQRCVEQKDPQTFALKPVGLWVSVDDAWHVAALDMFGDDELQHASLVTLASDAHVLRLKTVREIDSFTEQYAIIADERFDFLSRTIDWRRVAAEYQGIIIAPYQFERRLTQHTFWYYGWDCASGCIWDTAAIASVEAITESVALDVRAQARSSAHRRSCQ